MFGIGITVVLRDEGARPGLVQPEQRAEQSGALYRCTLRLCLGSSWGDKMLDLVRQREKRVRGIGVGD